MNTLQMIPLSSMVGRKILMIEMNDPYPVESGCKGVIFHVDDLGQYHVNWEGGRTLAVIPEVDRFEILDEE